MAMALTFKPDRDEAVQDHRHGGGPTDSLLGTIGRIFEAQQLFAIVKRHFNRPACRIGVQDLSGVPIQSRAVEHLVRTFAIHVMHQHDFQQAVLACLVIQRLDGFYLHGGVQAVLVEVQGLPTGCIVGPRLHARQSLSLLAGCAAPLLTLFRSRRRLVQRPLGVNVADQVHVFGKFLEHAASTVRAVAGHQKLSVGDPRGRQLQHLHAEYWSGRVRWFVSRRAFFCFRFFLPLVTPCRLR